MDCLHCSEWIPSASQTERQKYHDSPGIEKRQQSAHRLFHTIVRKNKDLQREQSGLDVQEAVNRMFN